VGHVWVRRFTHCPAIEAAIAIRHRLCEVCERRQSATAVATWAVETPAHTWPTAERPTSHCQVLCIHRPLVALDPTAHLTLLT